MAMSGTVYGSYFSTSGASNHLRPYITYSSTDSATSTTVNITVGLNIKKGYYTTASLTRTLTVAGSTVVSEKKSATYKASGWADASKSYSMYSKTYTYSRTTSAQSKAISFKLASSAGNSTASVSITIPALAKYTISYNNNGGSGSIASSSKFYGYTATLSNGSGFTKTNHSIEGWNTSADGTGTAYALSGGYSPNANATLYAQWHLDYIAPLISNFNSYRVDSSSSTTESDMGEYIYVTFGYLGGTDNGGSTYIKPTITIKIDGSQVYSAEQASASGTFSQAFGTYLKESAHSVEVILNDTYGVDTVMTATVSTATFPIDLLASGNDVYMGVMTPAVNGQELTLPTDTYINGASIGEIGIYYVGDYATDLANATSASPWVAPYSGIVVVQSATSGSVRAYWYVDDITDSNNELHVLRATRLETNNYQLGGSFPVIKGHSYYTVSSGLTTNKQASLFVLGWR